MTKIDTVRQEMMNALKNKEKFRKDSLSMLLSALKNKQIDKRAELTQEEENAIVLKEIKQCQETIETAPADRVEVIAEATKRIAIYQEFAPKMMDEAEAAKIIDEVLAKLGLDSPTPKDKGMIMKNLMPLVKGKADGAMINQLVAARMS